MTNKQIPQVTERNTKKEILEALEVAEKLLAQKEQGTFNPEKIAEAKSKKETVEKAESAVTTSGVVSVVAKLQEELALIADEIAASTSTATAEYLDINAAIDIKKAELAELYEIEAKATTLAGLIQAHQDLTENQKADFAELKAKFDAELAEIRADITAAKVEFEEQRKLNNAALKQEEDRRKAEFEYEFARSKQAREDSLNDELAAKRKKLAEEREEFSKEKAELEKRVEKQDELEAQVAAIPELIEAAEEKAAAAAKKKAETAAHFARREAEAESDAEIRVLKNEVDMLKEALANERDARKATEVKLEAAYASVENVAKASVEGARTENAVNRVLETINKDSKK